MTTNLENILLRLDKVKQTENGYTASCPGPSHENGDVHPSLSIRQDNNTGKIRLKCFTGCKREDIVSAIGLTKADLFPDNGNGRKSPINVEALASDKNLSPEFLKKGGVRDLKSGGVEIPYKDEFSKEVVARLRFALSAKKGSFWPKGSSGKIIPYGLPGLKKAKDQKFVIFVEGESDTWTLAYHGFPVLGIPGADMAKVLQASHVEGLEKIYLFQEPDNGGETFIEGMRKRLSELGFKAEVHIVRIDGIKDPNDLHKKDQKGFRESFQKALDAALSLGTEALPAWPDPQPLTAKVDPEPYPLVALPETIRAAVEEVQNFVKAPVPLVASAALAAMSVVCQAHIDVERTTKLQGPTSLFLLTIADSGERKTTCDGFFTSALRDYEKEQAEIAKPLLSQYQSDMTKWEAKKAGLKEAIKQGAKTGKPNTEREKELEELDLSKPEPPRVPRLIRGDDTPENLAWALAKEWPSAGTISSEAGLVLGSHGMGKDSLMRNLGLLNILWDGKSHYIGRRTSESFEVDGVRLTVSLQIQETPIRDFANNSGGLARGTGFFSRFLIAWPESTQGTRSFKEAPDSWPALAEFNRKLRAVLERPADMTQEGMLTPTASRLSVEAKGFWVDFHDVIESELGTGGELCDVRDVASKAADNVARMAALFQLFEYDGGAVCLEAIEGASRIVAWHLNEARRFFGELALPAELAEAGRLDAWLLAYCKSKREDQISVADIQKSGPSGLRTKAKIEAAMNTLEDSNRAWLVKDGKKRTVFVNPRLLAAAVLAVPAVLIGKWNERTATASERGSQ